METKNDSDCTEPFQVSGSSNNAQSCCLWHGSP
jgi:hypothetical protein